MSPQIFFYASTAVLALALFFPMSKLIWTMSVRRLERKTGQALDEVTRKGQLQRARFIAILLVTPFAYLFNYNVFGAMYGLK